MYQIMVHDFERDGILRNGNRYVLALQKMSVVGILKHVDGSGISHR